MNADAPIEAVLRKVEPAARLVSARHLRKILNHLRDGGRAVPANPALPLWVGRDDLRAADVLDRSALDGDLPHFLLMTTPDDRLIDAYPRDEQLQEYWRLLFRAAVLRAIDQKVAGGELSAETCAHRLTHFGPWVGREIRFVLESDHVVDPDADDVARYRAFASVYLDLLRFRPDMLNDFFPSLAREADAVEAVLTADVNAASLFKLAKPRGAAKPGRAHAADELWADAPAPPPALPPAAPAGDAAALLARATAAEAKGNFVRAAIVRTRAAAPADAEASLRKLAEQLGAVLKWDAVTQEEWRQAMLPLLAPAAAGIWPRAARCLYELQKIPNGLAQEVYAIDLPEFIRTLGRRPVKRHLPHARVVLLLMNLKRAQAQLLRANLAEPAQFRLDRLIHHEAKAAEGSIRRDFTPVVRAALEESGLRPANPVEEIARDKIVAELLDRVCDRGYLRIGDLRDAIARNQLKIADVTGPGEFFRGNALLKADVRLSYDLDGVYRRGEFYMRWLKRFSGLFFGTKIGRLVTLYLLIPFGGAFVTLMAVEELRHIGGKIVSVAGRILSQKPPADKVAAAPAPEQPQTDGVITEDEVEFDEETGEPIWVDKIITHGKQLVTASPPHDGSVLIAWPTIAGFGVFLLLMFHVPPFRRAVFRGLWHLWRAVKFVLWDAPRAVLRSTVVTAARKSGAARFANKYLTAAAFAALVVVLAMWALGADTGRLAKWGGITFAAVAVLSNTRRGWAAQDRLAEGVSDRWRLIRVGLLHGLFGSIVAFFGRVANWIEQRLYAVDEWLRFRGGDSKASVVVKAILGLVWFPIAYLTRFSFYLLLEPQVNPVKHFPVVTVSHKMLLPLVLTPRPDVDPTIFGQVLMTQLGLGVGEANFWGFWIIAGIPGIFGFIAWELKENWRLYAANRGAALTPVTLGSHGESMRGLLRPGFHSGTVPKIYRKLRAADRRGARAAVAWYHHDLEHAGDGVKRFAERELVPLLDRSPAWGGLPVAVGEVHVGCMRVVIELLAPTLGPTPFQVGFENRHGRIEAAVVARGWFDKLSATQAAAFAAALGGLMDMAAADLLDGAERGGAAAADPNNPLHQLRHRCDWDDWVVKWRVPAEPK